MSQFDTIIPRKGTFCAKWDRQGGDYLPMWVADMDFTCAPALLSAVEKRLSHGVFGYGANTEETGEAIVSHYKRLYQADITTEDLVWIPSVMPGANLACRLAGGKMIYQTPMYSHIRRLPKEARTTAIEVPMKEEDLYFTMDFDALEAAIDEETKVFILCNPHNPVGRVFSREELLKVADFCEKHDLLVVSDEIHCELVFDRPHIPFFTVSDWARNHSITLSSAGKISNIPGLPTGFAIIPNREMREQYRDICLGLFSTPNALSFAALCASYNGSCAGWKCELLSYLENNRDYMEERLKKMGLPVVHNEGTYLAWIDVRGEGIEDPFTFFRENAGVHMNAGTEYDRNGKGFVRLNFGCPMSQLKEALDLCEKALIAHRNKRS